MNIKQRFRRNPLAYYGLSIAASWAGVGSLMNSITITKTCGIVPSLIWAAANIAACIIFGMIVCRLPTLRDVMRTRAARYLIGGMGIFHIWLNMNGIREILSDTVIGAAGGEIIAYAVAIAFIAILLWRGMIRNIVTDSISWIAVYALIGLVTALAFWQNGGSMAGIPIGLEAESMRTGIEKAFLLLPGPFTFIYFYELMDYNEQNDDRTRRVDMQDAFTAGGLFFGAYMAFAFALAFTEFSPVLNIIKAVLISLVAISTISTFIYSIYIVFGAGLGLMIDLIAVAFWNVFMDMGVMGVWTLVASIRVYIVAGFILAALALAYKNKTKGCI